MVTGWGEGQLPSDSKICGWRGFHFHHAEFVGELGGEVVSGFCQFYSNGKVEDSKVGPRVEWRGFGNVSWRKKAAWIVSPLGMIWKLLTSHSDWIERKGASKGEVQKWVLLEEISWDKSLRRFGRKRGIEIQGLSIKWLIHIEEEIICLGWKSMENSSMRVSVWRIRWLGSFKDYSLLLMIGSPTLWAYLLRAWPQQRHRS